MLDLVITKKSDDRLLRLMPVHYSQPKGFVGRCIPYAIMFDGKYYGHIVAGSATKFLPNRNSFFDVEQKNLNGIVNNTFYHVYTDTRYPARNFTTKIVELFVERVTDDWYTKYGDKVIGVETLVEPPRTGELYRRAGFEVIGETKGYTARRVSGIGETTGVDAWGGKRVWDTKNLRPKLVFARKITSCPVFITIKNL